MNDTVLQHHLKAKTIPQEIITERLRLDRTTIQKWKLGVLYPHRLNAEQLIGLFAEFGIELDFNDIYRTQLLDAAV